MDQLLEKASNPSTSSLTFNHFISRNHSSCALGLTSLAYLRWSRSQAKERGERQDTDPTHRVFTRQTTSPPSKLPARSPKQQGTAQAPWLAPSPARSGWELEKEADEAISACPSKATSAKEKERDESLSGKYFYWTIFLQRIILLVYLR